jgi:hypothetical protein
MSLAALTKLDETRLYISCPVVKDPNSRKRNIWDGLSFDTNYAVYRALFPF